MKTSHVQWMVCWIIFLASHAFGHLPSDPEEYANWEKGILESIERQRRSPTKETLHKLMRYVFQMNLPTNREKSQPIVKTAAEEALKEHPDFPSHVESYILDLKEQGLESGPAYNHYLTERRMAFSALSQIHTPEVVEMFAGFLDDNDERRLPEFEGTLGQASASALAGMLENPPVPSSMRMDLWLEWRDRVREGKQAYSFKGSKKRYDFRGEVLATPREPRRSVDERPEQPVVDQGNAPEETPWIPVVGALLALVLGFAFWRWKARLAS